MEAMIQRFDLMEERMDELENENKGLKKEITSLKRHNIDYQEELSAVKSHMTSLDRKYRVKTQQEATPSTIQIPDHREQLSGMKDQIKSLKRELTILEESWNLTTMVTDYDTHDKRLSSLEQKFLDVTKRFEKVESLLGKHWMSSLDVKKRFEQVESLQELKKKSIFNITLTYSSPFISDAFTKFDQIVYGSSFNPGRVFTEETCDFNLPVQGFYGMDFEFHQIVGGEIEIGLKFPSGNIVTITRSDSTRKVFSRVCLFTLNLGRYCIVAKKVSGNPTGIICVACWLIQPF